MLQWDYKIKIVHYKQRKTLPTLYTREEVKGFPVYVGQTKSVKSYGLTTWQRSQISGEEKYSNVPTSGKPTDKWLTIVTQKGVQKNNTGLKLIEVEIINKKQRNLQKKPLQIRIESINTWPWKTRSELQERKLRKFVNTNSSTKGFIKISKLSRSLKFGQLKAPVRKNNMPNKLLTTYINVHFMPIWKS